MNTIKCNILKLNELVDIYCLYRNGTIVDCLFLKQKKQSVTNFIYIFAILYYNLIEVFMERSSKILFAYSNKAVSSSDIQNSKKLINELHSFSISEKIIFWGKGFFWRMVISPFFLLLYLFFYTLVSSRSFQIKVYRLFISKINWYVRRSFDILLSLIGLILYSFIFLIIAILIKLDSKGPVFYSQIRVGKNRRKNDRRKISADVLADRRSDKRRNEELYGMPFKIYKFRTMREDAEKKCGPVWATENDPRITSLGKVLRLTHLDELPQLYNILKGDMSFVGPRPERPYFVNQLADKLPKYTERLKIKPGLTGLAQIMSGYDYSLESVKKKLKYDLQYSKNGNLFSYFKIVFVTIIRILIGKKDG